MMLQEIVKEIAQKGILPHSDYHWRELKGGTQSTVGVIGTSAEPEMYVLKSNAPELIAAESRFYQLYNAIPLLPKVKYVDPEFRFMIYNHVPGKTSYPRGTKQTLLSDLANHMMQHYVQPEFPEHYEWVEDPSRVQRDIDYTRSVIGSRLAEEDHDFVKEIVKRRSKRVVKEKLVVLHGDFGVHNFLFENGSLSGIIDPIPVVGRSLYDLLYAFCSSPDDLHLSVLLSAVEKLNAGPIQTLELVEDTVTALYLRIGTCLVHHPDDLPEYLNAWDCWKLELASKDK